MTLPYASVTQDRFTSAMRTRLLALAVGALLAGGGVLIPASAQAAHALSVTSMFVSVDAQTYAVGAQVNATVTGRTNGGAPLSGRVSLTVVGPSGSMTVSDQPVSAVNFSTVIAFRAGDPGTYGVKVLFTPANRDLLTGSSASTDFESRLGGSTLTGKAPALTAGTSGTLTATLALADTQPAGGTVQLRLDDGDDVVTSCDPQSTGAKTAGCPLALPTMLGAGAHTAHLRWQGSAFYTAADATVPITVNAPASKGGGSGSGGGAAQAPAAAPTPTATPTPRATPAVTPTATTPAAIDPSNTDATSPIPLLPIIIAVIALLLCAGIVLTVVLVVRSRTPKPPVA
jgi:hypothetical protein